MIKIDICDLLYERDQIEKSIVTEFLVWIVSSLCVEFNGACLKKKTYVRSRVLNV